MNRYHARDILALSEEELWALPEERHIIIFDDGEVETHTRATILSASLWGLFRRWPKAPIYKSCHIEVMGFNADALTSIVGNTARWIWDAYDNTDTPVVKDEIAYRTFDVFEYIYNRFTTQLTEYPTTLSIFDLHEVMSNPKIKEANENLTPTAQGIEKVAYGKIKDAIQNDPSLRKNSIARSINLKTLSMGQVLQCLGPNGYRTDVNSDIFGIPIEEGYTEGITDLYGKMTESRTGTKASSYNSHFISDTETFNRVLQIVDQTVQRLHKGDCGGFFIELPIFNTKPIIDGTEDEDEIERKQNADGESVLKTLEGKYYKETMDGEVKVFKGNEYHLIGKRVLMRSVLGCIHPDPEGICETCYGKMANNVPDGTNIGHYSATVIGDSITSAVLSVKHLDGTSHVDPFRLGQTEVKYLDTKGEDNRIYFRKTMKGKKMWLRFYREEAENITELAMVDNPEALLPERLTSLSSVEITIGEDPEDPEAKRDIMCVSLYNRKASLSLPALKYIQRKGWTDNTYRNNFLIDFSDFPIREPLFNLPNTHVNMVEYKDEFERFIFSKGGNSKSSFRKATGRGKKDKAPSVLYDYSNNVDALVAFAGLTQDKVRSNIVHREILLYSMLCRDPANGDYRLTKPGIKGKFAKQADIVRGRSLGPLFAWQDQAPTMFSFHSFLNNKRNSSPFDDIISGGIRFNKQYQ